MKILKAIYRLAIILAAFALVAGGVYAFANTSAGQSLFAGGRPGGGFRGGERGVPPPDIAAVSNANTNNTAAAMVLPPDRGGGLHEGRGATRSLVSLATNAGKIALITALVVGLQRIWIKIRRKPTPAVTA